MATPARKTHFGLSERCQNTADCPDRPKQKEVPREMGMVVKLKVSSIVVKFLA